MHTARFSTPILLLFLATGCSVNPATGQREFNIVSEGQEISMDQEAHREVVKQFGVYDEKPELNRMVDDIGRRLAAQSDRPSLPWHFTLLDTPMINAMALPGGYIYVTRGMMERVNSEAELAGVIGHEIAHVTARHAAQRISRAQVAQFGMLLGAVQQLQGYNVQDAVRRRFQEMGLQYVGSRQASTRNGDRFPVDVWAGQTEAGRVGVETTQFPHGDHVAVFLFVAPGVSQSQSPLGDILQRSEINPQRARSVEPPRMKIGTVKRGETWSDLARRATGNAGDAETVAHINGYDLNQQPPAGLTVKLPQDVPREKG